MKVLLAVDGAPCSRRAVEFVAERAWHNDDTFTLVGVVEPIPKSLGYADHEREEREREKMVTAALDEINQACAGGKEIISSAHPDNAVEARVVHGHTVEEIIKCAHELEADLIVLGSHGRTGFQKLLMGSVAERVLKEATCPVEIVKTKEHHH